MPVVRAAAQVACSSCALRAFCQSDGGSRGSLARRALRPGEALFRAGDAQAALYAVHAGFIKTCAVLPGGERRIVGYQIMGDVLGLDAMGGGVHPTEAVALGSCEVCVLPVEQAERLMAAGNEHATALRKLLSEHIARGEAHIVALAAFSARQRVAGFLLDLASRWASRGYSATRFQVCLTRREIGSYLGLTFETVSRALSYFSAREWIVVAGRDVTIRDHDALQAIRAGGAA